MATCSSSAEFPDITVSPHQPVDFNFPKRPFGVKSIVYRSFQATWFKQWPFLHYDELKDAVYCHTCVTGFKQGKMRTSKASSAFVSLFYYLSTPLVIDI